MTFFPFIPYSTALDLKWNSEVQKLAVFSESRTTLRVAEGEWAREYGEKGRNPADPVNLVWYKGISKQALHLRRSL